MRMIFAKAMGVTLLALAVLTLGGTAFTRPYVADDKPAGIGKAEYRTRRAKLSEKVKDGIVVLVGAREEDFGEVGRFRQLNDFMYLTGVGTPAAYFVLVPAEFSSDKSLKETLFIPPRNLMQERWTGPQIGPGLEAQQLFGISAVEGADKFFDRLTALLNAPPFKVEPGGPPAAKLYTVIPRGPAAPLSRQYAFIEKIKAVAPHAQIADVAGLIAEQRKVKSKDEIALIQKAIDITGEGQVDAAGAIRPGVVEYQVQAALEYAFARSGAERPGFPSIVGSGFNSTVLHYNQNRKPIEDGDVVVVDIGAEYSYYTADVTRTYPASGKFTARQREIYLLVLEAQRAAEKAFKPGQSTIALLNRAAIDAMRASSLRDRGGNTLDKHFIHGLGHWLGMDVHDVGSYSVIPPGAVFTIEPGIYIAEEKLGIRIEDDYLATETGLIKLSSRIASEPGEVERLMAARRAAVEKPR